jgi:cyanophycinase-like exopeptidase
MDNVVIDLHFAERGRMGRLLGAVAQNPRNLGLGIDENTAIVLPTARIFRLWARGPCMSSMARIFLSQVCLTTTLRGS